MPSNGSYFIDRHAAEKAVGLSLPMIESAMTLKEVGESGFLYIVVMDPLRTPSCSSFEEAILYEHAIGDRSKWDADYAAFARAKARVAWRAGMDSHLVQELRPYLLVENDTVLWGSVVVDGIVVAVSGANPWYDEAFAGTVAMCLRALAKAAIAGERKRNLFLQPKQGPDNQYME
ncbi:MAG TPA: hypothetical protein VJ698_11205 [Noviherbaspirillum sp.]|uniref:hypothetical protein n=1 Tax=Noviherbaspirillum sp. TaxID=1926288 RepID=UPI002B49D735|nr:hypothetical protein [Noviherbaspirillum sp.]HJV86031.1 hypothetical protein [Noviherbaspirillum sp.]